MTNLFDLGGRTALVTGASRGIGKEISRAFLERGASVVMTGRKAEKLAEAVSELNEFGGAAKGIVCHQGDPRAIQTLFKQMDSEGIALDILVINAATNPVMAPLAEVPLESWNKILEVNLTGALLTAQAGISRMSRKGKGTVIFIASVAGISPVQGLGAYGVSKAGLLGLMRGLAMEVGSSGVRVNAIVPGLVATDFSKAIFQDEQAYQSLVSASALRRHGQPSDLVGAAVFLASDASNWITGQALVVDGGTRM